MSRTEDQIYSALGATYDPQINQYQGQLQALPAQYQAKIDADTQALQGQQNQAYDNIVLGARRRGVGFSGIPLGEQAQYNSNVYMPALTNMYRSYNEQQAGDRNSLLGYINELNAKRRQEARSIYESDRAFEADQANAAASRAASAWSPFLNPTGSDQTPAGGKSDPKRQAIYSQAMQNFQNLMKTGDVARINKVLQAWRASAAKGNQYDLAALDIFHNYRTQKMVTAPNGITSGNPYYDLLNKAYWYKPTASAAPKSSGFTPPKTFGQIGLPGR